MALQAHDNSAICVRILTLGTELLVWRCQCLRMDRNLGGIYHHFSDHGFSFGLVLEPRIYCRDMACLLDIPSHELLDGVVQHLPAEKDYLATGRGM